MPAKKKPALKAKPTKKPFEARVYRLKGAPVQAEMVDYEKRQSLLEDAATAVLQNQGVLCDAWSESWNLAYELFPHFYLLQRDLDAAMSRPLSKTRLEELAMVDRKWLVQSAYELGLTVGPCYAKAVEPRIVPLVVKGTFRAARGAQ